MTNNQFLNISYEVKNKYKIHKNTLSLSLELWETLGEQKGLNINCHKYVSHDGIKEIYFFGNLDRGFKICRPSKKKGNSLPRIFQKFL